MAVETPTEARDVLDARHPVAPLPPAATAVRCEAMSSHLPDGTRLAYGTATAAYQVEGSTTADGRGPSIWDTFTARPGTIKDGSDGSVACASYQRLRRGPRAAGRPRRRLLPLLGRLAAGAARPASGAVEPRGLAYYDRLVDGLLARGVQPMATLYHWDLPQPLEDAGGWPERDDRRAVRRLRRDRARPPRRPGAGLGDAQRAVVCRLPRLRRRRARAGRARARRPRHRAAHHLLLGHGLAAAAAARGRRRRPWASCST